MVQDQVAAHPSAHRAGAQGEGGRICGGRVGPGPASPVEDQGVVAIGGDCHPHGCQPVDEELIGCLLYTSDAADE